MAGNDNATERDVADAVSALNGAVETPKADAKMADEKKAADTESEGGKWLSDMVTFDDIEVE